MDLDKVRWKLADELLPEEKDFLNENREQLNDEEKAAFSEFLTKEEPATEEPENPEEVSKEPEPTKEEVITFKTEAERDAYVEQQIAERKAKESPPEPLPAVSTDELTPLQKAQEFLRGKTYATAEEFYADQEKAKQIQREAEEELVAKRQAIFENEYKQLVKEKSLPDVSTEEGIKTQKAIRELGIKNGKQNYHEAYELWSQMPEQFGGGFKIAEQKAKEIDDKETLKKQKQAASMVGKGGSESTSTKTPSKKIPYKDLRNKDIDTLIEEY